MEWQDKSVTVVVEDENGTARVAGMVARAAVAGDVIALRGDLGSGKTAFARAFIRALTSPDEEVPSPTFTLVQAYPTAVATIHDFDFYRIEDPDEAWEIGIEEAFAGGISLIEWPERLGGRLGGRLPAAALNVILVFDGDEARRARLDGGGDWPDRLAELRP